MQQSIWLSEVIHKERSRLLLYNLTAGNCFDRSLQRVNDRRFAWQTTHQIVAGTKPKNSYGAPKSECVCIWQLIFWRGGRIFKPTKTWFKPTKTWFKKREVQESLSEKKNRDDIDSPPQFGEFQYQLRLVFSTYRVTYETIMGISKTWWD